MAAVPYRVLIAKPGLDSHDRGARALAAELIKEGFEVVYTGVATQPELVARSAVDEDVDVLCLSMHVAAHTSVVSRIIREMNDSGGADIPIVCGGVIPQSDHAALVAAGVAEVVQPMMSLKDAVDVIESHCRLHRLGVEREDQAHDQARSN